MVVGLSTLMSTARNLVVLSWTRRRRRIGIRPPLCIRRSRSADTVHSARTLMTRGKGEINGGVGIHDGFCPLVWILF